MFYFIPFFTLLKDFLKNIFTFLKKCLTNENKSGNISKSPEATENLVGVDCGEGPPVPIPNTEVKLTCAEDTWREAARENK